MVVKWRIECHWDPLGEGSQWCEDSAKIPCGKRAGVGSPHNQPCAEVEGPRGLLAVPQQLPDSSLQTLGDRAAGMLKKGQCPFLFKGLVSV